MQENKQNQRLVMLQKCLKTRRLVKRLTKESLRRIVYIVEEVLVQLILFSHLECQEAALCGDSLVASMGVTQDDQVAP